MRRFSPALSTRSEQGPEGQEARGGRGDTGRGRMRPSTQSRSAELPGRMRPPKQALPRLAWSGAPEPAIPKPRAGGLRVASGEPTVDAVGSSGWGGRRGSGVPTVCSPAVHKRVEKGLVASAVDGDLEDVAARAAGLRPRELPRASRVAGRARRSVEEREGRCGSRAGVVVSRASAAHRHGVARLNGGEAGGRRRCGEHVRLREPRRAA